MSLSLEIKAHAERLGFDLAGICPAVGPEGFAHFQRWLQRGHGGEMAYLERHADARRHPRHVLDGVRSLVLLGMNYRTSEPAEPGPLQGKISRYAWGEDYHNLIRGKLRELADFVRQRVPECQARGVVDTAPLLERDFARLAGLGWFGKNTMLLNKRLGSWFFLAALLVEVELEYDEPHATDHCGTCTRCLDACPTGAFVGPYQLDSRRCISYLTIELRSAIPEPLRERLGSWIFGCDVCQDVCPWNRKAPRSAEPAFEPGAGERSADLAALLQLDDESFQRRFGHTALERPRRSGLLRNAAIVLGNRRESVAVPALCRALEDCEAVVRGAAAWSLGRIGTPRALAALERRLAVEADESVRDELRAALAGGDHPAIGNDVAASNSDATHEACVDPARTRRNAEKSAP